CAGLISEAEGERQQMISHVQHFLPAPTPLPSEPQGFPRVVRQQERPIPDDLVDHFVEDEYSGWAGQRAAG
ncbi:MAG: hypothetical protein ACO3CC_20240, partial [Alphaproteobacteria bacterium]